MSQSNPNLPTPVHGLPKAISSVYLSIYLPICLSSTVYLSSIVYLVLSICLSTYLFIYGASLAWSWHCPGHGPCPGSLTRAQQGNEFPCSGAPDVGLNKETHFLVKPLLNPYSLLNKGLTRKHIPLLRPMSGAP